MHEGLSRLAEDYWEYYLETRPTSALMFGDHRYDDQIEQATREFEDADIARLDEFANAAEAIDPGGLSLDDRVTRGTLIHEARSQADMNRLRIAEFDISPSTGFHIVLLQLVSQLPIVEPEHADAIVTKAHKIGTLFDQIGDRHRQGIATGRTPSRTAVEKVIGQLDGYLASPLDHDPFLTIPSPPAFSAEQTEAWKGRIREAIEQSIRPGYESYRNVLRDEVLAKARPDERAGVRWLPDGEEVYARAVAQHTTLPGLTALEIHQIGLDEIADLENQYRQLGTRVFGTSDIQEIYSRLRDDPALRYATADEVREASRAALDRARAAIPEWFGRLPRAECILVDVPAHGAEQAPLAFYLPPSPDGSRPGSFFINVAKPETQTRYEIEALAFHESIPGHHLQLAISQELDDIPNFRKHALVTAYAEGWGLYTERLADEMGLYSGDLEHFGILSFDSWRAGRLVVDTGIHALGWSRQEAIDFLAQHSPQTMHNIETEVDRYIGWPGQALAYKIGQREILRLRADARAQLGDRFDIKGFHDAVLGYGLVPLPVLADIIDDWVAAQG